MKKKRFKIGETFYNIPENEVSSFLTDNPNAIEVRSYSVEGKNYNVPLNETEEFETDFGLKKKETVGATSLADAGIGVEDSSRTLSPFKEDFRTGYLQPTAETTLKDVEDIRINNLPDESPSDFIKNDISTPLDDFMTSTSDRDFTGKIQEDVFSSPESLSKYNKNRIDQLNNRIVQLRRKQNSYVSMESAGVGARPVEQINDKKAYSDLQNQINNTQNYISKLKSSVANVATEMVVSQIDLSTANPIDVGRNIVKISEPELEQQYKMAEDGGHTLPGIQRSEMERLGIATIKKYLTDNPDAPNSEQSLKMVQSYEKDFDERNFELTGAIVREKLAAYFYRHGKSGQWNYSEKTIEDAVNDPDSGLTEAQIKVAKSYVIPLEKRIIGTQIPGSGFFRSFTNAIERSTESAGRGLLDFVGQRNESDAALDVLNQEVDQQKFAQVGESARAKSELSYLKNLSKNRELTSDEKNKVTELEKYTNVRNLWSEFKDGVGDLTGQVVQMALVSKGLGAVGKVISSSGGVIGGLTTGTIGKVLSNETVGLFVSSALNSYDSYLQQSISLFPGKDKSAERQAYSTFMMLVEAGTEGIFKDTKVLKAFTKGMSPTVSDITRRLVNREITQEVARNEFKSSVKQYFKTAGKEFLKAEFQESFEEGSVDWFDGIAQSVFGGQPFDVAKTGRQALKTFATTAIYSPLVSGLAAHGAYRQNVSQNAFLKSSLVDMGAKQSEYLKVVEQLQIDGSITPQEANDKIKLIKQAGVYLRELPEEKQFDFPQVSSYLLHRMNEGIATEKLEKTTDKIEKSKLENDIKRSEEIRKGIYDNTIGVTPRLQEVAADQKEADKLNILSQDQVTTDDLIGTPFEKKVEPEALTADEQEIIDLVNGNAKTPEYIKEHGRTNPRDLIQAIQEQASSTQVDFEGNQLSQIDQTKSLFGDVAVEKALALMNKTKEGTAQSDLTASEVVKGSEEVVPSVEQNEDVTWDNLIKTDNTITYNGKQYIIGKVKHEGKARDGGGFYDVFDKEGNRIFSEFANQVHDSFILYQNGKGQKQLPSQPQKQKLKEAVPSIEYKIFYRGGAPTTLGDRDMRDKTLEDVINYERDELGNEDVILELGINPKEVSAKNLHWLTEKKSHAKRYGVVDEYKFNKWRIVARDNEGGVLVEDLSKSELPSQTEKQQPKEAAPSIDKFPKTSKPLSELSSDELRQHVKNIREYQKNQEVEYFGVEGAKKYKEAQSVSNNPLSSFDERKAADVTIKKMEDSLTPEQYNNFFGIDTKEIRDPSEILDIAQTVSLIEQSENANDLSRALKLPLLEFSNNPNNEGSLIKLGAAKKRAEQLGIDPKELIKKSLENIAGDLKDKNDAAFLVKDIFDKLSRPEEQKQLPSQTQKQQPNEQQTQSNEVISQSTQTTEATATPVNQTTEILPAGEAGVQENAEATIPDVQTEQEKVLTKPKIRVGSAQAEAAQIIAEEESKPIPEKNKAFHDKVDKAASSLIKALSAKLPEGTRKQGLGIEEIVNVAAAIVKKAYDLGTDIKAAIDEAVQYVKDQFKKEGLGDVDENVVRKHFEDSVSSANQDAIKEKRKEILKLRNAQKDISEFSIAGLDKKQVEEIFKNRNNLTPQVQKIIDTVYDRLGQTEGTKQNQKLKEDSKIAEGKKILDEVFSRIRKGEKVPRTYMRIANSDLSDLIPYLKDKFSTYKAISLNQLEAVADSLIDIFGVDIASQMVKDLDINEKPIAMAKIAIKLREEGRNSEAANMMAQLIQTGTATGQAIKSFDRIKSLIGSVTDPTFRTEFQKAMYEREQAIRNSVRAEFNLQSDEVKQKIIDMEKLLHEQTIENNKSLLSKFIDKICGTRQKK